MFVNRFDDHSSGSWKGEVMAREVRVMARKVRVRAREIRVRASEQLACCRMERRNPK